MTLETLQPLLQELDAWQKDDLTAELWWRDDHAAAPSVELDRLFDASERHGVPCGLAAIQAEAGEPLRKTVSGAANVWILQHGGDPALDAAPHRPKSSVLEELRQGMLKFNQLYKDRFVSVLVPGGDRINSELLPYLPVMGYRGLSLTSSAPHPVPPGDLLVVDVHADLLTPAEEGPALFDGGESCVAALVAHLRDKRTGQADETEPTGLRTLHTGMGKDAWAFLDDLFGLTSAHPAARWMSPAAIWTAPE